jgi:leader peptidase (prepilin peptidase) / N-methyltransferase
MWLILVGVAALAAAAGVALSHRVAYRLSVPAGREDRGECGTCDAAFPPGAAGWLTPRRRCPKCHAVLGGRWWPYCLAAAGAGGAVAWGLPHTTIAQRLILAAWLVFVVAGVLLSAVDIQVRRLPTRIIAVVGLVDVALLAAAAAASRAAGVVAEAASGCAAVGGAYLVLALGVPAGFGLGDVRLAALVGLLLGVKGWNAVMFGAVGPFLLAAPVAAALLALRRIRRNTPVPFGVPLVAGAILAALLNP